MSKQKTYWPLQRNDDGTYERFLAWPGFVGLSLSEVEIIRYRPDLDSAVHNSNGNVCEIRLKENGNRATVLEQVGE